MGAGQGPGEPESSRCAYMGCMIAGLPTLEVCAWGVGLAARSGECPTLGYGLALGLRSEGGWIAVPLG